MHNPYFIGAVGSGEEMEYEAGYKMAIHFAENYEGDKYFILSSGAGNSVGMHQERTKGILDELQDAYHVKLESDIEELLKTPEEITAEGSSFAAMYNALTGYAKGFRENGQECMGCGHGHRNGHKHQHKGEQCE